ncbi:MAG: sodium-dependent dicarboxylate transporter 2/3/5 [Rhodothermales bacterium]|jgi:sodium-dependent dicarboxylate transporter 2/3/5
MSDEPREAAGGFAKFAKRLPSIMLFAGPTLGVLCAWIPQACGWLERDASLTLGISVWTALWWIFEPIPIPVTSLLPLGLLPMAGVLDGKAIAGSYGHSLVLLLLGGFILSRAMEKSGAHRRIALMMVNGCGGGGGRSVVFGFMLATAVISMWISNTATTLMMLPMAIAILQSSKDNSLRVPLLLGIAFAANVGGIGTPIGTPPNLVFMGAYKDLTGTEISFVQWMKVGVPIAAVMLVVIWLWLTRKLRGSATPDLPEVGTWRPEERRTLLVFAITALAWVTRSSPFGGWKTMLEMPMANDACVAFIAVIVLFCLPNGEKKGEKLLDWKTANEIPWGLLLLVGSGLAIGSAFKASKLSDAVATLLSGVGSMPTIGLLFCVCILVTFLTEMTSNTATTNVLMPILGATAVASSIDPMLLMLPAALSASCAFMLPVATMPNAVVFGTGEISISRMAREGFILNLLGAVAITLVCYFML